mgnify:CR=1 FL=1
MPQRAAQAAPSYCPVSDGVTLPRRAGAPACFLWYDRHIEKNGGSTLRNVLKRLEEHGECAYWGYHLEKESWSPVMATLRRPSRALLRMFVVKSSMNIFQRLSKRKAIWEILEGGKALLESTLRPPEAGSTPP